MRKLIKRERERERYLKQIMKQGERLKREIEMKDKEKRENRKKERD